MNQQSYTYGTRICLLRVIIFRPGHWFHVVQCNGFIVLSCLTRTYINSALNFISVFTLMHTNTRSLIIWNEYSRENTIKHNSYITNLQLFEYNLRIWKILKQNYNCIIRTTNTVNLHKFYTSTIFDKIYSNVYVMR